MLIGMNKLSHEFILLTSLTAFPSVGKAVGQRRTISENDLYRIAMLRDGAANIIEKKAGSAQVFTPEFIVMHAVNDPKLSHI
jgi:hypothetical protein